MHFSIGNWLLGIAQFSAGSAEWLLAGVLIPASLESSDNYQVVVQRPLMVLASTAIFRFSGFNSSAARLMLTSEPANT